MYCRCNILSGANEPCLASQQSFTPYMTRTDRTVIVNTFGWLNKGLVR